MPVTQLETDPNAGSGIGKIVGMVGGYLASNPERKAQKAQQDIENKRNAQQDADTHSNIQSEIASRTAATKREDTTSANTQFQNGAYSKAIALLGNLPKGTDPQAWANSVWQKAVAADVSTGGFGLSDPKLMGDLYAQVQEAVGKATAAKAQRFISKENVLPGDPSKALPILMKRLQIERGQPGVDTKQIEQTEAMISEAQRQIGEMQARAHQSVLEQQGEQRIGQGQQRLEISLARGGSGGGAGDPASLADVTTHLRGAKNRDQAQAILDSPEASNLSDRQYDRLQKQVDATYGTHAQAQPKAPNIPQQRATDASAAQDAIRRGGDYDAITRHYAAKWNIPLARAQEELTQP